MIQPTCTNFKLNDLSYLSHDNLENHYQKYIKYITNTNKLCNSYKIKNLKSIILHYKNNNLKPDLCLKNASQAYNHEIFWESLSKQKSNPVINSKKLGFKQGFIDEYTYDLEAFWKLVINKSLNHFGYGWSWIIYSGSSLEFLITEDWIPYTGDNILFNIDLWEHAYYCDYGLDMRKYLEEVVGHLNWGWFKNNQQ